jgi:Cu/Ag efflux protein CusF
VDGRRGSRLSLRWGVGLFLALILPTVSPASAGPSFDGQGRITAIDPARGTVTVEHGEIAGLFPATQSEFPVQSASLTQGLRVGDRVRFTLGAADDSHGLLTVTSLAAEPSGRTGWLKAPMLSVVLALGLLTLAGGSILGVLLWRQLQSLEHRVVALDHEVGMLRGLGMDTQDGVREVARALEEAATALRVGYIQELRRRLIPGSSPAAVAVTAGDKSAGDAVAGLVVVQRGRGDVYRAVEGGEVGPGLAVIWDRRRSERRRGARRPVGHERRHSERRGSPPETWTRLGFQLVPGVSEVPRAPRALRSVSGERGTSR